MQITRRSVTTRAGMTYVIVGDSGDYSFSGVDIDIAGAWATWDDAKGSYERAGWVLALDAFAALPAAVQLQRLRGETRNPS